MAELGIMNSVEESSLKKGAVALATIVFGVLIALFAESTWIERGERSEARQYLNRLGEELLANSRDLAGDSRWAELGCSSAEELLQHVQGARAEIDPTALVGLTVGASIRRVSAFRSATYEALIATGSLGLISDPVLREGIIATYRYRDVLEEFRPPMGSGFYRENVIAAVPRALFKMVVACMTTPDGVAFREDITGCFSETEWEGQEDLWPRLLRTPSLERNLSERVYSMCEFVGQVDRYRARLDALALELDP